jgi:putative oxidoreductase
LINREGIFAISWLEWTARMFLGLTFIVASVHKISAPADFAKIVYGYALFPSYSINMIALVVPYLELVAGAALVTGIYPRSAALLLSVMLLFFIAVISFNLMRGHQFDCGCFSLNEGQQESPVHLLMRDMVYLAAGGYVLWYRWKRKLCLVQSGSIFTNTPIDSA